MDYAEMNPFVRFAHIVLHSSKRDAFVQAYDHRLFYVLENGCTIKTKEQAFLLRPGDLLLLPPALPYAITGDETVPCRMVLLNFDLDCAFSGTREHPPDLPEDFRESAMFSPCRLAPFDHPLFLKNALSLKDPLESLVLRPDKYYPDAARSAKCKLVLLNCLALIREAGKADVMEAVRSYLDTHYLASPSNKAVAEKFNYHPYYLNQQFQEHFGVTMHGYVMQKKLDYASRLLLSTDWSVVRISETAGFCSAAWFAEQFRARNHMTPTEYRKMNQ